MVDRVAARYADDRSIFDRCCHQRVRLCNAADVDCNQSRHRQQIHDDRVVHFCKRGYGRIGEHDPGGNDRNVVLGVNVAVHYCGSFAGEKIHARRTILGKRE